MQQLFANRTTGEELDATMQAIAPLRTTARLSDNGIFKKWPWKDSDRYELMSNLILKSNYSSQDFNATIESGFTGTPKDTVYLIVLATWIKDAYWHIKTDCLRKDVEVGFSFSKKEELVLRRNYLEAVRSAVVAHPVNTDKHGAFGFGSEGRICLDIRRKSITDSWPGAVIRRITPQGEVAVNSVDKDDIALMTCLNSPIEGGGLHFERYCLNMVDIRDAAALYMDALYELDRYLMHLRKADFETASEKLG